MLVDKQADTLEEAIAKSLSQYHRSMFASKSKHIRQYPSTAIFELGCNRSNKGCRLPNVMKLGEHNYNLRGTINFIGQANSNGHYEATIKGEGDWIRCNDQHITSITSDEMHKAAEGKLERAVCVCYTRDDSELRIRKAPLPSQNAWVVVPKRNHTLSNDNDVLLFGPNKGTVQKFKVQNIFQDNIRWRVIL